MNIFIIIGQTATGKTGRALEKASQENADIINFDSRQVYKHLDIVTSKDLEKPQFHKITSLNGFDIGYYLIRGVKVWLYDIVDPKTYFSSYDYASCALYVLQELEQAGKNAILTGGTYLYLYHLLYEVETEQIPPDQGLRKMLNAATIEELQDRLKAIDPVLFDSLNQSEKANPQRLIRKLEIASYYAKNKKKVPHAMKHGYKKQFPGTVVDFTGIAFKERDTAKKIIAERVQKKIEEGALQEVRELLAGGYTPEDPGLRTIGYQELIQSLHGEDTFEHAVQLWTTHELQYTKRQLTFMKKDPHITWISV